MSLAKRVIPTILSKRGMLVKGERFKADRIVGNALQAARIYAARGVDELVILDVTASKDGREPDYKMIEKLSEGCFAPLTVGGGVETEDHVRNLLRAGADKVLMGFQKIDLVQALALKFGRQCIVVSIDVCGNHKFAVTCAKMAEKKGAGEILLQSHCRDGTMQGYDLELIRLVTRELNIPVIASGGCSGYNDMAMAIECGADAVAAGALFQYTDCTPKGAAEYLSNQGIEARVC